MASLLFRQFVRRAGTKMPARDKTDHSNLQEFKKEMKHFFESDERKIPIKMPVSCDVLIAGGGIVGMAAAYFLAKEKQKVVVVERDPQYKTASTVLSVGGIRSQFGLAENIQMSLYAAEFLRNIRRDLAVPGMEPVDVQFHQHGYLILASENGAETLENNSKLQKSLGAVTDLLSPTKLKEKFPWLNTDDVALASYGVQNEGWLDPYSLLRALRAKAASMEVDIVQGELVGFDSREMQTQASHGGVMYQDILEYANVKGVDDNIYPIKFAGFINAAGYNASKVAAMAGIGNGEGLMSVPLPVEPRKRNVFGIYCPHGPGLETPIVVDPKRAWFRREGLGGLYLCGMTPTLEEEPDVSNLDVDHDQFQKVWPIIAHRSPCFEEIKVKTSWASYNDFNYFDENLIIGNHIVHRNFVFANGSSGHGLQHGPAIGRALKEYILDGEFKSIDLRRMGFDRVLDNQPLYEKNIF